MRTVRCRVRESGPMQRLELDAGKLACPVLRGQGGSNAPLLPDQALETKAKFIGQVMTGQSAVRRADDIGGQELSYAEVKAIASGNPAVLTLAEADAELQRLAILHKNHADEQYLARRNVRDLPDTIARLSQRLAGLTTDMQTLAAHADDPLTLGRGSVLRQDAAERLAQLLASLPENTRDIRRAPLGVYCGLRFGLVLHPRLAPEIYLEGTAIRQSGVLQHRGARAVLNALERLAGGYAGECAALRRDLAIAQSQLGDYQARLGKPSPHAAYFAALTELRDELKAALSGAQAGPSGKPLPAPSELANRINALKNIHHIEAAPQRTGHRRAAAEEPVTARIRRLSQALPAAAAATEPLPADPFPSDASTPATTHQERAASRRTERQLLPL